MSNFPEKSVILLPVAFLLSMGQGCVVGVNCPVEKRYVTPELPLMDNYELTDACMYILFPLY